MLDLNTRKTVSTNFGVRFLSGFNETCVQNTAYSLLLFPRYFSAKSYEEIIENPTRLKLKTDVFVLRAFAT